MIMKKEKNKHYISGQESNQIAKDNAKAIKELNKRNKAYTRDDYVTEMKNPDNVVEFENLHTYFYTDRGVVKAVNGVSFEIPQGSTVGIVGESGCGKSVTSMSLMRLIQAPMGQIVDGSIRFRSNVRKLVGKEPMTREVTDADGNVTRETVLTKSGKPKMVNKYEQHDEVLDIAKLPMSEMSHIRGREIAMIFQEPMTSLNPVFTVGYQLDEVTLLHVNGATKEQAKAKSIEMLSLVGIAMPEHVYKSYPHELSGGMKHNAHNARFGRHSGNGGLCGGNVRRQNSGERHRAGDIRQPSAPLHGRTAKEQTRSRQGRRPPLQYPGQRPQPHKYAVHLLLRG